MPRQRLLVGLVLLSSSALAADPIYVVRERIVDIGTAGNFAILAAGPTAYVTATASFVTGSIGAGAAITFTSTTYVRNGASYPYGGIISSVNGAPDSELNIAIADFRTAYNVVKTRPATRAVTADVLMGCPQPQTVPPCPIVYTPGTYEWQGFADSYSDVVLVGGPDDVFVFKIKGYFTIAALKEVRLVAADASVGPPVESNVVWHVENYVTMGAGAVIRGTILSGAAISFGAGAKVYGRALCEGYVVIPAGLVVKAASVASVAIATGGGSGDPAADPVTGQSQANVATGFSQTALGAIIGALLGLCLLCGVGAYFLHRRRKDAAFRKTLSKAIAANSGGATIVAVAPPAAQAERPPGPIRRRSSGLQYVKAGDEAAV
ncbi:hypothetical protein T492DRAFT_1151457 [Pavlovales sp. CCMP2436]|nr:hypothetical protein T492DRAFT_1151457 [Pavlovales sp. CCMP2436]